MFNKLRTPIIFIAVFILSLVLDQVTKIGVEASMLVSADAVDPKVYAGKTIEVLTLGDANAPGSYFDVRLIYFRNLGIAWGNLNDLPADQRLPILSFLAGLSIIVVGVLIRSTRNPQMMTFVGGALVVSGAIGNMIDRFRVGYVIDFVASSWRLFGWEYHFPIFNVADIGITLGFGIVILSRLPRRTKAVVKRSGTS